MTLSRDTTQRLLDIGLGGALFFLCVPLQVVIAIAVWLDSGQPIVYRAERVGRYGRPFTLYKFRTMVTDAAARGPRVTAHSDSRLTRLGRLLRRAHLDELPQLWNVLRGDMALVGPRPEDPRFVAAYTPEQRRVLAVRPGLTGRTQLAFRKEAAMLDSADPEGSYTRNVLPRKIAADLEYLASRSVRADLVLIWQTCVVLARSLWPRGGALARYVLRYRRALIVACHLVLVVLANYLAFALRFDGALPIDALQVFSSGVAALIIIRLIAFQVWRLYEGLWRYTGLWDLRNLAWAVVVSSAVFAGYVELISPIRGYPRSIYVIDGLLIFVVLGGLRLVGRLYREAAASADASRVLIVGAGDSGALIAREMRHIAHANAKPIGFIDDDPSKRGLYIHGVRVLGARGELGRIVKRARPDEIVVALPNASAATLRDVVGSLEPFDGPIKILPGFRALLGNGAALAHVRPLSIADLLQRPPVGLDDMVVRQSLAGRRVMVTGAGGSIGSELCRQIAGFGVERLIMLDRYENGLYSVERTIERKDHGSAVSVIGDVADRARMRAVLAEYRPEVIFHAAAHKHVPLMEANPCEAVKNNVGGTKTLVETAVEWGVERFVLISTDKAVNPTSVMGATKRVAELTVRSRGASSKTRFLAVRFGNVLGSNGSVVPLFSQQIASGGPVTVTHPEVRRFFMLIPEAIELVLHASTLETTGGTFILEMGEQIKVADLAGNLIKLAGLRPGRDIKITYTGLRPGEKLSEELVADDEHAAPSGREGIRVVTPTAPPLDWDELASRLERLAEWAYAGDRGATLAGLRALVPTYEPERGGQMAEVIARASPENDLPLPRAAVSMGSVGQGQPVRAG